MVFIEFRSTNFNNNVTPVWIDLKTVSAILDNSTVTHFGHTIQKTIIYSSGVAIYVDGNATDIFNLILEQLRGV